MQNSTLIDRRLAVRSLPVLHENILGLLLRLSEANSYCVSSAYRIVGIGTRDGSRRTAPFPVFDAANLADLADLTGCDTDALSRLDGWRLARNVISLAGDRVSPLLFDARAAKVCPACLAERGFMRSEWRLSLWTVCPVHRCKMLTECPRCGMELGWNRKGVDTCCDGFNLSDARTDPADEGSCEVVRRIARSMSRSVPSDEPTADALIGSLSAADLMVLMTWFDHLHETCNSPRTRFNAKFMSRSVAGRVIRRACDIFGDWPRALHGLLRRYLLQGEARINEVVQTRFKALAAEIRTHPTLREFPPLKREFEEFKASLSPVFALDRRADVPSVPNHLNLGQAAQLLGVSRGTIAQRIKDGELIGEIRVMKSGRLRYSIETSAVLPDELASFPERELDARNAQKLAGIVPAHLRIVSSEGCIAFRDTGQSRMYSADSIRSLLEGLRRCSDLPTEGTADSYRLTDVGLLLRHKGGLSVVLAAIELGHIRPIFDEDGIGLGAFRISCRDLISNLPKAPERGLTKGTAGIALGCSHYTLISLIENGLLETSLPFGSMRKHHRISVAAVDRFRIRYCTLELLSIESGLSVKAVESRLRAKSILPVRRKRWVAKSDDVWMRSDVRPVFGLQKAILR